MHHQTALVEDAEQIGGGAAFRRTARRATQTRAGAEVDDVARGPKIDRTRVHIELRLPLIGHEAEAHVADVAVRRIEERRRLAAGDQGSRGRVLLEGRQSADAHGVALDRLHRVRVRRHEVAPFRDPHRTERIGQQVQGVGHPRQGDRSTGGERAGAVRGPEAAAQDRHPGQELDLPQRRRRQLQRQDARAAVVVVASTGVPVDVALGRRDPKDRRIPVTAFTAARIAVAPGDRGHVAAGAEQVDAGVVTPQREAGLHDQAVGADELTRSIHIADRDARDRGDGRAGIADAGQDQIAPRIEAGVPVSQNQGDAAIGVLERRPQRIKATRVQFIPPADVGRGAYAPRHDGRIAAQVDDAARQG
ncbi:hypothetical protein D3C86_684630 [compost metagenome]